MTTHTHYLPYFGPQHATLQYAACGTLIRPREHSIEPTCPECRMYVENTGEVPSADDLFGSAVHDTPNDVEPEFDPCANYRAERSAR